MHRGHQPHNLTVPQVLSHLIAQAESSDGDGECMAILSTCWCMLATTIPLAAAAASAPNAIRRLLPTLNTCSSVTARTSIASGIGFCFALCHQALKEDDEHESFADVHMLQEQAEAALKLGISESSKKPHSALLLLPSKAASSTPNDSPSRHPLAKLLRKSTRGPCTRKFRLCACASA